MQHVYILAGTLDEAREWVRNAEHLPQKVTIIYDVRVVQGRAIPSGAVAFVGSWLRRTDLAEISHALAMAELRHIRKVRS